MNQNSYGNMDYGFKDLIIFIYGPSRPSSVDMNGTAYTDFDLDYSNSGTIESRLDGIVRHCDKSSKWLQHKYISLHYISYTSEKQLLFKSFELTTFNH